MDTDATTPSGGQASPTAGDDFKITKVEVDPKERCPVIYFQWRGVIKHGYDYVIYKNWALEGRFGLGRDEAEAFKERGIKFRQERHLEPWPYGERHDAPGQLHDGSKFLQSAMKKADTLAEQFPQTAPKKEHIDSMLALDYEHELAPIQEMEEVLHFTPQFVIDEDGKITLFDPDGPLEAGRKAKELRHASPSAGALAELIVSQIRIEAVELGPGSDAFQLMWWDGQIYRPNADKVIASCVQSIMGLKCKKDLVNETIAYIERMKHLLVRPVERSKICLKNGILDLDTGELTPFRGDMVFTSIRPIVYEPDAEPWEIVKFLREVLDPEAGTGPEGELLDFYAMMEYLGTCLEPGYRWQKGAILVGKGANGKGVWMEILNRWLGPENVSSVSMEELGGGDKYAAADLVGKSANICGDISGAAMRDTATLKKATGGDRIHAQRKYGQPFSFQNEAKMIFSCNSIPESPDLSIGWTRRWLIFNFPKQFIGKDADPNLADKLSTPKELSGLLNLALEGRKRLIQQGYFTGHDDVEKDRQRYLMHSDPAAHFLARYTYTQFSELMEDGIRSDIPQIEVSELYATFVDWCNNNHVTPVQQNKFSRKVQEVYPSLSKIRIWIDRKKNIFRHHWYGLGLTGII